MFPEPPRRPASAGPTRPKAQRLAERGTVAHMTALEKGALLAERRRLLIAKGQPPLQGAHNYSAPAPSLEQPQWRGTTPIAPPPGDPFDGDPSRRGALKVKDKEPLVPSLRFAAAAKEWAEEAAALEVRRQTT